MNEFGFFSFAIKVAGAAALLIWAVRLVRTGFERTLGSDLRKWLRHSTKNRFRAALTGAVSALLLQSSTAVAVLTSGFLANGLFAAPAGLAILLGADLGSAAVTQLLIARPDFAMPVLLLLGGGLHLKGRTERLRQTGRIMIGLALIFLSLDLLGQASAPLQHSETAKLVMVYLSGDLAVAFLVSALFTWAVHSSVASVLLWVTLAGQGILPMPAALAMVLGANLGGAFIAFVLTYSAPAASRQMVFGNLLLRGGGAAIVLILLSRFGDIFDIPGGSPAQQVINFHLLFNSCLLVLGLPFVSLVAKLAKQIVPEDKKDEDKDLFSSVTALNPEALSDPQRAMTGAVRETLRLAELLEAGIREIWSKSPDMTKEDSKRIRRALVQVLGRFQELKFFLAKIEASKCTPEEIHKAQALTSTAISLETAADLMSNKLLRVFLRLKEQKLQFSAEGRAELDEFFDLVLHNIQLGIDVLLTQNPESARHLVQQKERTRQLLNNLQKQHMERLGAGNSESIETSAFHLDVLNTLKLINTSFSMIGYPILEERGELLRSRLQAS